MTPRFFGNPFYRELSRGAAKIAPTDSQCERLLQRVLQDTDRQTQTSYADGVAANGRMATANYRQRICRVVASGAGAAAMAAGLSLVLAINPAVPPTTVMIEETLPPLSDGRHASQRYATEVIQPDNETTPEMPRLTEYYIQGSRIVLIFAQEDAATVAWDQLCTVDDAGNWSEPTQVDTAKGTVEFALPEKWMEVRIATPGGDDYVVAWIQRKAH